jgi:hypothetical protein
MSNPWIEALALWNKEAKTPWRVPLKGSKEYKEVLDIMSGFKEEAAPPPPPPRRFKRPTIIDDEPKQKSPKEQLFDEIKSLVEEAKVIAKEADPEKVVNF